MTCASQAGNRSGRSSCSSRPVKWIRSRRGRGGVEPVGVDGVEERVQVLELALAGRLRAPGRARRSRRSASRSWRTQRVHEAAEGLAVGAEAHHHEAGVGDLGDHERPGREQQVHALRHDQLAHVAHDPVARRVELVQRLRSAGLAAPRGGGVAPRASSASRSSPGRVARALGPERVDVHSGRAQPGALGQVGSSDMTSHRLSAGVARAHQHRLRAAQPLQRVGQEALGVGAHRVLERAAVDLDGIGSATGQSRAPGSPAPITRWLAERHVGSRRGHAPPPRWPRCSGRARRQ